jgi:polar amino acid transport system substrate-binding protein
MSAALALLVTGCTTVYTEPTPEARTALAPTGKLRVGLYRGNPVSLVQDPTSKDMKGLAFDLGKELARRLGVPFDPVVYPSVGALLDATGSGQWDVAFFLVSPARAKEADFTPPLVELELGYLVPKDSSISASADVDRPGIRVAVAEKGQADVILSRSLKQAVVVRAPGLPAVVERVKSGHADAIAANKAILHELSGQLPGSRVLQGRFATERLAMAVPKGRNAAMPYARRFVEDAKSQGLVKAAMERAGVRGAVVAPPE